VERSGDRGRAGLTGRHGSDGAYDLLKGILILVIIAGHNEAITCRWPSLRHVFYYFNVQCFFMLSFVLDRKPFSAGFLRDRAVRYLVPYVMFMMVAAAAYLPMHGLPEGLVHWIRSFGIALYNGQESSIHAAVGMRVFWFLPALFSLVILRSLWTRFGWCRAPLLIAGLAWMGCVARVPSAGLRWLPLGAASALFFFLPCLATRWLHDRITPTNAALCGILATAVSLLCGWAIVATPLGWVAGANPSGYDPFQPATFAVGLVFPTAMFFVLLAISHGLHSMRLLQACGKYSLGIFLVHMFIYRGLTLAVFGRQFATPAVVGPQLAVGLIVFAATVVMSLALAVAIPFWPRLNSIVFPRDWASWRAALLGRAG